MVPPFTDFTAADSKIEFDKISLELEQAVKTSVESNSKSTGLMFKTCFDSITQH